MKSHNTMILNHLIKHKHITPLVALNLYGCYRLASVIHRLRNKGYIIDTRIEPEGHARYSLISHGEATIGATPP